MTRKRYSTDFKNQVVREVEELQVLEQENALFKKLVGERELQLELLRNQIKQADTSSARKKKTAI